MPIWRKRDEFLCSYTGILYSEEDEYIMTEHNMEGSY